MDLWALSSLAFPPLTCLSPNADLYDERRQGNLLNHANAEIHFYDQQGITQLILFKNVFCRTVGFYLPVHSNLPYALHFNDLLLSALNINKI